MMEVEVYFREFIKIFTVLTARLYGLWPHRFDSKVTSFLFLVYSMVFACATVILFYIYYFEIFKNLNNGSHSVAIHLIDEMYFYLIKIQFITLYLAIYLKHKKVKRFLTQVTNMYEVIFRMGVRYLRIFIVFLFKSVAYDFCYTFIVTVGPLYHSVSPLANFFGAIIINLPPIVVRVVPNLYYGCIMGGQLCYHDINKRIRLLRSGLDEDTFITIDCICDELDKLCMEHFSVTKLMNECNKLCSLHVVILIVYQILALVFNIILQVVYLRRGINSVDTVFNFILFTITMYDLYTTFAVCEHIQREVDCTTNMLNSILFEGMHLDKDIRKSLQAFSTQIMLYTLSLTGCGMFEFGLSTFHAAFATMISHVVFLLPFELNEI